MKKGAVFFLVLFLFGFFFFPPAPAFAQIMRKTLPAPMPEQAAIASFSPNAVRLLPDGPAAFITVEGRYLETVLSAQAVKGGRAAGEIAVWLVQPWPASRQIGLKAGFSAPVAQDYQLRAIGKAGLREFSIDVPLAVFRLEVAERMKSPTALQRNMPPSAPIPNLVWGARPDLVVDAIRIDPPNPKNDPSGFLIYATIRNQGGKDAFLPRGWHLAAAKFSGQGNFFDGFVQRDNTTLAPGGALEILVRNCRSAELSPAGTWTVAVKADPDKQIAEIDEHNNEKSIGLTITDINPPPLLPSDLVITSLRLEPAEATTAGNFKLVAVVTNQGNGPAIFPDGYDFISEQGRHLLPEQPRGVTLQPSQSMEIRRTPQKLQVGTFTWTVFVDPFLKVPETDETNNTKMIQVIIK